MEPSRGDTFGHHHAHARGPDLAALIIPDRYRAAHHAGLARLVAGEPGRRLGQRLQLEAVHADGHEFPIELTLTATTGPAGRIFHAFCHDVTAAQRISRFADVEAAVSRGLAQAPSSHAAVTRVVEALGMRMDWPVTELWLTDDDQQVLCCAARHAAPAGGWAAAPSTNYNPVSGCPAGSTNRGRALWIPDRAADTVSLRSRAAARIGLHVAVGVPISTGARTIGALCVYGDRVEDPEDSLTSLLTGIAAQVGQYLERRRAEALTIELARTKDEFLALVAHELRNPLAVITSTASLLEEELDGLLDADQRQYVHTILRGAERWPHRRAAKTSPSPSTPRPGWTSAPTAVGYRSWRQPAVTR